jgi:nucleoside-diphosphate-sugar epimerase
VCAAAPGQKWKANREPAEDLASIRRLLASLREARADNFILVSTVDVYNNPDAVDETTPVQSDTLEPYGKHRYLLEVRARQFYPRATIVRLPGLFGRGLKKNFVYDLLNGNPPHLTHSESVFQFYDMNALWADLQTVVRHDLPLVNLATEPVKAKDVARVCFGIEFENDNGKPPARYDMRTRHGAIFGVSGHYLYSAGETLRRIRQFAAGERGAVVGAA